MNVKKVFNVPNIRNVRTFAHESAKVGCYALRAGDIILVLLWIAFWKSNRG
jgi:hypothetical protein